VTVAVTRVIALTFDNGNTALVNKIQ
jgi:hypothetical protein